jgi:hypothetical protein
MSMVPVELLKAPKALAPDPPMHDPVMLKTPTPVFCAPKAFWPDPPVPVPPIQEPVIFRDPVDALFAPIVLTPIQEPVIFSDPVDALCAPNAPEVDPPMQSPEIIKVPAVVFLAPCAVLIEPPLTDPTMVADSVPEKSTHAAVPANTLEVSVTPFESVNDPPAVAPPVVSLRTSPLAPRAVETLIVTAKLFAMRTSPATNVTAPAVPLGVVAQTSVALMFPALRAK